jgi:hypothetical protein
VLRKNVTSFFLLKKKRLEEFVARTSVFSLDLGFDRYLQETKGLLSPDLVKS